MSRCLKVGKEWICNSKWTLAKAPYIVPRCSMSRSFLPQRRKLTLMSGHVHSLVIDKLETEKYDRSPTKNAREVERPSAEPRRVYSSKLKNDLLMSCDEVVQQSQDRYRFFSCSCCRLQRDHSWEHIREDRYVCTTARTRGHDR